LSITDFALPDAQRWQGRTLQIAKGSRMAGFFDAIFTPFFRHWREN